MKKYSKQVTFFVLLAIFITLICLPVKLQAVEKPGTFMLIFGVLSCACPDKGASCGCSIPE